MSNRISISVSIGIVKTSTPSARISLLISSADIDSLEICLICFARMVINELRARICNFLRDPSAAKALRLARFASLSWPIYSAYKEGANLLGSFAVIIKKIKLVKENEGIFGYPYSLFRFWSVS